MNSTSNPLPESSRASEIDGRQAAVPMMNPGVRPFYWTVRRELWENRSLYIAPLAIAAVILFGFLVSSLHSAHVELSPGMSDPSQLAVHKDMSRYDFVALLLMATTLIVAVFYCLEALHGERRDRSILFWKSLPVSDLTTVLAKASIPMVVLPLITLGLTMATQWLMLLIGSLALLGHGVRPATLWSQLPLLQMWTLLFFHLLVGHGFYYAPFYGWLLLVSSWAKRAVFLWAALPVVAISVLEMIVFNSTHFAQLLGSRIAGGPDAIPVSPADLQAMPGMSPLHALISPSLWVGLAITAAFLALTVRIRRSRGPI